MLSRPQSTLARSIIYYNKDYWFRDRTPGATGMTATESNREVNVLIGSNTEYRKKIRHLRILITGPAY